MVVNPADRAAVERLWEALKARVGGKVAFHLMGGNHAPDAGGASLAVAYLTYGRPAANEAETSAVWDAPYGFLDTDRRSIERRLDLARRGRANLRRAEMALSAHGKLYELLDGFYPRDELTAALDSASTPDEAHLAVLDLEDALGAP